MNQRRRRTALIILTACVWTAAIAASTWRFKLAAKANVTVTLMARPSPVRLVVDGERLEGGAWLDTPRKFLLSPGKHKLKISRDGYIAHLVNIEGYAGTQLSMEDVVLDHNDKIPVVSVEITTSSPDDPALTVEIDDGFVRGETPLIATDVTADQPHSLAVYPKWPDKTRVARCRFLAKSTLEGSEPGAHKIVLKAVNERIRLSGCERPNSGGNTPRRH